MAKVQTIRRVVRMSHLTANRIDAIAERMGMTPQQALQVMVANSVAATSRSIELVDGATGDLIGTMVQEALEATNENT